MPASSYYSANREAFLAGLTKFLSIPSISTFRDPDAAMPIYQAANFVRDELERMDMHKACLIDGNTGQHPLVSAEWLEAPGKPTLLIYGHYDVQPPDPLNEWISPPFTPTVRNNNIYARGAADDKGQVYLLLKAVEGHLEETGKLPINIKFLIEGEEESGGEHIASYVREHASALGVDAVLICDTEMFAEGLPTITTGLRGLVYAEIECRGARQDLHSGLYGGAAPNAFHVLTHILAGLKTRNERITIPGFYSRVSRPSRAELTAWRSLAFDAEKFREHEVGAQALVGDRRIPILNRLWARPTLDIHGIVGGYMEEGAKTVIPAKATAKVSMRLVPDMDPDAVANAFQAHVQRLTPAGYNTEVRVLHTGAPVLTDTNNRFVHEAAAAMTEVFGRKTVFVRSGASIPIAEIFSNSLGLPVVLAGFGLPDDNIHAPNEKFHLPNFFNGIEAIGRYLELLGREE